MAESLFGAAAEPSWTSAALGSWQTLYGRVAQHAPGVLAALTLCLGAWGAAVLVRATITRLLGVTRLDAALTGSWFGRVLAGLGEGLTPSRAIAQLAYLAILLLSTSAAAGLLGLSAIEHAIGSVLGYLPRVGSALLVLAVGGHLAATAKRGVGAVLREIKSPLAGSAQTATEAVILLVVVALASQVLGLDLSIITANVGFLVGALVVTMAFLFCWSMRTPAENIIANYYLRRLANVGDPIELGTIRGTVQKFAPLGVVVRDERGDDVFVPARHLLGGMKRTGAGVDLRAPAPRA